MWSKLTYSGLLGRILGAPESLNSTVLAVTDALDKFEYQTESEERTKAITDGRGMVIDWMRTTQGQNLSRRIIALLVTVLWLSMFLIRILLFIVGVWYQSVNITTLSEVIGENISEMTSAVMLILGFYFAAPHIAPIMKGVKSNIQTKNK